MSDQRDESRSGLFEDSWEVAVQALLKQETFTVR